MSRYEAHLELNDRVYLDWTNPNDVRRHGLAHGPAPKLVKASGRTLVVKVPGWSENPGSTYSGLRTYYPTHMVVYLTEDGVTVEDGKGWAYPMTEYDVRPKQEKSNG